MRIIFFILTLLILGACTLNNSSGVYWCGDHPCINKKEKEAYFKENMIVEKRNLKIEKSKNKDNLEKIIDQAKIKEKKREISEKELLKEVKKNEKERLKNEKKTLKEAKIREKQLLKQEKKLEKQLENKIKNDEKNISKNTVEKRILNKDEIVNVDLGIATAEINISKFTKIKEKIFSKNSSRSFPDINNIPN